jgi:DNA transformation protein
MKLGKDSPGDRDRDEFARHCLELFIPAGTVRMRRMFGGHGIYIEDLFVALIIAEQLYLKGDPGSRSRFERAGCRPFVYQGRTGSVAMSYFSAPEEAMESPALMQPWARLALEAAWRARASKAPAAVRKPRSAPPAR